MNDTSFDECPFCKALVRIAHIKVYRHCYHCGAKLTIQRKYSRIAERGGKNE